MFCLISLLVFSFLGIFSATHRKFAREAFDCVFRRVTFRPCNTGFREKVRGIILVKLMKRSSFFAKIFNKYFELISWIFFILMLVSTIYVARGGYNFYLYGNCNGINEDGFCLFDPSGENSSVTSVGETCGLDTPGPNDITMDNLNLDNFFFLNNESENNLVFIGCYLCPYSRKAFPAVRKLIEKKKANLYFAHLPIKHGVDYLAKYDYCARKNPEKYMDFVDLVFSSSMEEVNSEEYLKKLLIREGYNYDSILQCASNPETTKKINSIIRNIETTNIYGTPLMFLNNQTLVGPKPYRVLKRFLK